MKNLYSTACWRFVSVLPVIAVLAVWSPQKGFAQEAGTSYVDARGKTGTFSIILVDSCAPLFEAAAETYPEAAADDKDQMLYFEKRAGRTVDFAREFNVPGDNTLSADDISLATSSPTRHLMKAWKPGQWAAVASGKEDAAVDAMAKSIKSIAPKKMMLILHHEMENAVTSAPGCTVHTGKTPYGTAADYVAMFRHVHERFAADGVTNVIWGWNIMGFEPDRCMLNQLFPGDKYVDWILWENYTISGSDWLTKNQGMYDWFVSNSTSAHDYKSHPFGNGESGISGPNETYVLAQFKEMKDSLDNNTMPNLKLRSAFDSDPGLTSYDARVGCSQFKSPATACTPLYQSQQNAFNAYINDPKMK